MGRIGEVPGSDSPQILLRKEGDIMKKNVKRMSQAMSLGLCAALMATTALAATGTPYSGAAADIAAPAGQQATLLVDGKVTRFDGSDAVYTDADKAVVVYTDDLDDSSSRLSAFTAGGADETDNDYAYHTALYVNENGVVDEKSVTEALGNGAVYDGSKAENVTIHNTDPSFNGIIVSGGIDYTIAKATIRFDTDGDGLQACDFSGKGTAITSFGEGTKLTVEDSDINVSGVANMTLFADSGSLLPSGIPSFTLTAAPFTTDIRTPPLKTPWLPLHGSLVLWELPGAPIWRAITPP